MVSVASVPASAAGRAIIVAVDRYEPSAGVEDIPDVAELTSTLYGELLTSGYLESDITVLCSACDASRIRTLIPPKQKQIMRALQSAVQAILRERDPQRSSLFLYFIGHGQIRQTSHGATHLVFPADYDGMDWGPEVIEIEELIELVQRAYISANLDSLFPEFIVVVDACSVIPGEKAAPVSGTLAHREWPRKSKTFMLSAAQPGDPALYERSLTSSFAEREFCLSAPTSYDGRQLFTGPVMTRFLLCALPSLRSRGVEVPSHAVLEAVETPIEKYTEARELAMNQVGAQKLWSEIIGGARAPIFVRTAAPTSTPTTAVQKAVRRADFAWTAAGELGQRERDDLLTRAFSAVAASEGACFDSLMTVTDLKIDWLEAPRVTLKVASAPVTDACLTSFAQQIAAFYGESNVKSIELGFH